MSTDTNEIYQVNLTDHKAALIIELKPAEKRQLPNQGTNPIRDPAQIDKMGNVAYWGSDNLYPQFIYKNSRNNTIVPSTIERKVELLIAGGWDYGIPDRDDKGKKYYRWKKNPELERFMKDANIEAYLMESAMDLYWFQNFFPEIVKNRNTGKPITFSAQEAMYCRWSLQNEHGIIPRCYINANWDLDSSENGRYVVDRPVINRYFQPVQDFQRINASHLIYPVSYPSPGADFYQISAWHSAVHSGWLALSNTIAAWKKYALENGITIKKIVYIDSDYWAVRFSNWESLTDGEKTAKKREVREEIEQYLTGSEKAMTSLFLAKSFDPITKQERKYITIEDQKNEMSTGELLPESQEAASHLLYALAVPYTLLGNSVGKGGMGAGSGSDVAEHLRMYLLRCRSHINLLLEPLNRVILPAMGWDEYEIYLNQPAIEARANLNPEDRNFTNPAA